MPALIVLAFCALAMVPVVKALSGGQSAAPVAANASPVRTDAAAQTAVHKAAAIPEITFVPQQTAAPTPTVEPAPTPQPTDTPRPTAAPAPTPLDTLPVVHRADIESKKIAITVDDCYQLENLKTIVSLARDGGGRLTLFPVGQTLSNPDMAKLMRRCVFDLGFEVENHTWSHSRIFRLPDEEMAAEIWKQDAALDRALGVDYQAHFLRLMGGDGDTDPRIHSYLAQLGYLGIANWSVSGSDSDLNHIKSALAPGQVYLFHCTDKDTAKLEEFIPWAVSQGYKLVTLNELFKLGANEISDLTAAAMPQPICGVDDCHTIREGEYTWVTVQLQDSLRSQGYLVMDGPSTGYFGPQTAKAVADYQRDHGLEPTGEADVRTQRALLDLEA